MNKKKPSPHENGNKTFRLDSHKHLPPLVQSRPCDPDWAHEDRRSDEWQIQDRHFCSLALTLSPVTDKHLPYSSQPTMSSGRRHAQLTSPGKHSESWMALRRIQLSKKKEEECSFVGWLLYLRNGSAQAFLRAATLR